MIRNYIMNGYKPTTQINDIKFCVTATATTIRCGCKVPGIISHTKLVSYTDQ